jgi:integrase
MGTHVRRVIKVHLFGPDTRHGAKKRPNLKTYIWHAVWYEGKIRRERSLSCGKDEDYSEQLTALQDSLNGKRIPAREALTVLDILDNYATVRVPGAINTRGLKERILTLAKFFDGMLVDDINEQLCREYAKTRNSDGTARLELGTLKSALVLAEEPPIKLHKIPVWRPAEPESRDRVMSRAERQAFLTHWQNRPHFSLAFRIAYETGARIGSILALRWDESPDGGRVDLDRGYIFLNPHMRNTTKKRKPSIPIPPALLADLTLLKTKGMPWVCQARPDMAAPNIRTFEKAWRAAATKLEIEGTSWHTLRHTRVTDLVIAGGDLLQISQLTGMSLATLQKKYLHLQPDFVKGLYALDQAV